MSKNITDSNVFQVTDFEANVTHVSCGKGRNLKDDSPIVIITRTTSRSAPGGVPLETEITFFDSIDRDAYFRKFGDEAAKAFVERGLEGLDEVMTRE